MRKTVLLIIVLTASAAAQSGRRIAAPPPPPPPPTQTEAEASEPPRSETENTSTGKLSASAALTSLPESLLNHKFQSLDKGSFRLADFRGKVLVINLWATWCGPCRMEVPEYEQVRKKYAGRDIEFVALTVEDPHAAADRVKQFVRDFNFGFRLGWADRETARALMDGRSVIPQTLVIAPDGRILNHWHGYSRGGSGERLREAIERALAGS